LNLFAAKRETISPLDLQETNILFVIFVGAPSTEMVAAARGGDPPALAYQCEHAAVRYAMTRVGDVEP